MNEVNASVRPKYRLYNLWDRLEISKPISAYADYVTSKD